MFLKNERLLRKMFTSYSKTININKKKKRKKNFTLCPTNYLLSNGTFFYLSRSKISPRNLRIGEIKYALNRDCEKSGILHSRV